jgi:hypothetical protein
VVRVARSRRCRQGERGGEIHKPAESMPPFITILVLRAVDVPMAVKMM